MDLSVTEMFDSAEDFAHVAHEHSARPRFQNPVQLMKMKMGEGLAFEVDSMELEDGFEDDEEEVYDEDVLSMFSFGDQDVDEKEKTKANADLFDVQRHAHTDFPETEKLMKPLNEEGTVLKMVIRSGSELQVPERSKLYFHYAGICEGEDEVFDTTMARKYPNVLDLRKETTIPGLALAVKSMCLSEVARFIIYPEMGFGTAGCPPRIPPDSKIMYVIQMLQFINEDKLNTLQYMTIDERNQLPFEEIVEVARKLRADGNLHYNDNSYGFAIKKWRKAINMLEDYPVTTEKDEDVRRDYIWKLYSNLAQSFLKLERPAQACSACKIGLKSAVENEFSSAKLLYRFAKAKKMLMDPDAALDLVNRALKIEPDDKDSIKLKVEIVAELGKERQVFKKMFNPKGKTTNGSSNGTSNGISNGTHTQPVVKTYHKPDSEAKHNLKPLETLRSGFDMDDLVDDLAYCTPTQKELVVLDAEKAKTVKVSSKKSPNRIKHFEFQPNPLLFPNICSEEVESADSDMFE